MNLKNWTLEELDSVYAVLVSEKINDPLKKQILLEIVERVKKNEINRPI